jgi:zinc transporter ZupT
MDMSVALALAAVAGALAAAALFKKTRGAPWCPPCLALLAGAGAGYFVYCLVRAFTPR